MSAAELFDSGAEPGGDPGPATVARDKPLTRLLDLNSELTSGKIQTESIAFGILAGFTCVAATFGVAALRLPAIWSAVPILAFAALGIFSALASRRRLQGWVREQCIQYPYARAFLNASVPALDSRQFYRVWSPLLRQMSKRGDQGIAVRVQFENTTVTDITPLTTEFEPLPMNRMDERFRQLAASGRFQPSDDPNANTTVSMGQRLRQETWRNRIILSCWVLPLLVGISGAITSRRFDWWILYWAAMILAGVLGPFWTAAARGDRFLLVPGGLIWRRGRLFDPSFRLHLFRATDSLLAVVPLAGRWSFYLRDAEHETGTQIDDSEAEMLLRAWLSPLPPPDTRLLDELAGKSGA